MPDFSDYTEEERSAASIKAANMMRVVRANARAADGRDMQAYDAFRIVAVDALCACDRKDAELLSLREMLREGVEFTESAIPFIECDSDCGCKAHELSVKGVAWLKKAQEAL